ncbi:zinc finger CCCH domain-containing protein 3 isoform X2 [Pseudophryne corroboree]|uniref:zinc finger CCCH domain-containing protein 3 isoform X2 n=1 Tax=Pseudophryne corroboree TaxID=495146 RepID=UPI003081B88D
MDGEKESLRRQILLLQGLINSHKKVHGDAPAHLPPENSRWRKPGQPERQSHGESMRGYPQQPPSQGSSWRKKYSLVNRNEGERTSATATDPNQPLAQKVQVTATAAVAEEMGKQKVTGNLTLASNNAAVYKGKYRTVRNKDVQTPLTVAPDTATPSTSTLRGTRPIVPMQNPAERSYKIPAGQTMTWTASNKLIPSQGTSVTQSPSKRPPLSLPHPNVNCSPPALSAGPSTLSSPKNTLRTDAPGKGLKGERAKYTWVANPPKACPAGRKVSPSAKRSLSVESENIKSAVAGGAVKSAVAGGAVKSAVAGGAVKSAVAGGAVKSPVAGGAVKSPVAGAAAKGKKSSANHKCLAPKSRYKWKAEPRTPSPAAPVTPSHCAVHRIALRTSPHTPYAKPSHSAGNGLTATFRDTAHSSYKIKSRTKIVRRRSNSRSPVEKKSSPLAPLTMKSHYCLRRRTSPRVKSPATVKRNLPRGLVHISKHRLRRLPPSKQLSPAASSSSLKSSASSRVIKTRYRIVKRNAASPLVASPLSTLSSSLTWRTRLLLLKRMRLLSQTGRFQSQQRWRSRGLCFIGGVMYRVSANKLSKTWSPGSGGKQNPKTGKVDVRSTSPGSLYPSRSATPSRYIASRAVQRSLAIIRHAQQQKKKKEYCMYYNRFGKCNRGQKCPYIHDPEKVAVCTRFLRGTCKKTDGTCPFSHKVSKDKMPVCSYFLKGICHNNDCPYSHVYVSRKAEVCQDFVKGYCPTGAKCKKKHTLLCPDYARNGTCPQGSKCKLQHRQRKRWIDSTKQSAQTQPSSTQPRQAQEDSGLSTEQLVAARSRDVSSTSEEETAGSSGWDSCPSFISLNCSSASDGTPVCKRVKSAEDSGKPLQIKPRL